MIYTRRLTLRPLSPADSPFMLRLLNDAGFIANIGDWGVRSLVQAEAYLHQGPLSSYQQFGFGLRAIELTATQELIGVCGLLQREQLDAPDLGYALLAPYTGKGYAIEAAKASLQWAITLKIPSLYAVVNFNNHASEALLQKLGFTFQCPLKWHDNSEVLLYHLTLPVF